MDLPDSKDLADRLGMSKFDKGFWLVGMALMAFGLLRFAHFKDPIWLLQSLIGVAMVGYLVFKRFTKK